MAAKRRRTMGTHGLLWCIVLLVLSAGVCVRSRAAARPGVSLSKDNPLRVLFDQDPAVQLREDLEREMATVSIIMGMLALSVAVPALVWNRRFRESVARLERNIAQAAPADRLTELMDESRLLRAQVDDLKQGLQAEFGKIDSTMGQWEKRIAGLEQGRQSLDELAGDLGRLRESQNGIESTVRQWADKIAVLEQDRGGVDGLQDAVHQLESSVAVLDQGYQGLAGLARELEGLQEFRKQVEEAVQRLQGTVGSLKQGHQQLAELHQELEGLRQFRGETEGAVQRLQGSVAGLEQGHQQLAQINQELEGLRQFRGETEAALQRLQGSVAGLEQGYRDLSGMTKDLESLRDFRNHVERVHAGIQKAFNGVLAGGTLVMPQDEGTPETNA